MSTLPNPKAIKALALDLDGTILAPGPELSDRAVKAVKGCTGRGIKVIIATGRAIASAERFRAALGVAGPMVYFNGAIVAEMPENKILRAALLDKKAIDFCINLSREKGVYYQVFFPGNGPDSRIALMAERDDPERKMYGGHTGIFSQLVDLKEVLGRNEIEGCYKSMFIAEPEILAAIRPRLDEYLGGNAYIAQTTRTFLEIMNAGVSKGQGLKTAMEHLSLKREEIIAFGDEENDLPMFDEAGFSVAPSNAKDAVKARADLIIGSNSEDGVAVFLEEFFIRH